MDIVKITNRTALITVVLLVYWVFIFVCTTVFGFKIFKENLTEIFSLSILGIFSLLFAAIILNIMFNLTAIAENKNFENPYKERKKYKKRIIAFCASFPLLFIFMYVGNSATSKKKESYLVQSARDLIEEQKDIVEKLGDYNFSTKYIEMVGEKIELLGSVEEKFPTITLILRDEIDNKKFLLGFTRRSRYDSLEKEKEPSKVHYVLGTSSEERQYLNSVFDGKIKRFRFSSNDGRYEIYYPVETEKGMIVLHLSQYSRYGKYGS